MPWTRPTCSSRSANIQIRYYTMFATFPIAACICELRNSDISSYVTILSQLPPMRHIFVSDLDQHWFRQWLVACSTQSHYLNQYSLIVNWALRNKLQRNWNQNTFLSPASRGRWVYPRCSCSVVLGLTDARSTAAFRETVQVLRSQS